jgi:hydrogenase maturation factor
MRDTLVTAQAQIVVTKQVALSGTYVLGSERYEQLHQRYAVDFLESVRSYDSRLTYEKEYEVLAKESFQCAVECGYGGIFQALFTLGYAFALGLRVDLKRIPITQPTIEVAEFFDLNPYMLHSGGAMVIACVNGERLVEQLARAGVDAVVVGHMTKEKARIVYLEDEERFLTPVHKDELVSVIGENSMKLRYTKEVTYHTFEDLIQSGKKVKN